MRAEAFETACYLDAKDAHDDAAILNRMTQIQTHLERSYFKAYKELERIKTARAKAARQPVAEPPKKKSSAVRSNGRIKSYSARKMESA